MTAVKTAALSLVLDRRALSFVAAVAALVGGLLLGPDAAEAGIGISHGR